MIHLGEESGAVRLFWLCVQNNKERKQAPLDFGVRVVRCCFWCVGWWCCSVQVVVHCCLVAFDQPQRFFSRPSFFFRSEGSPFGHGVRYRGSPPLLHAKFIVKRWANGGCCSSRGGSSSAGRIVMS